jgi:hypothetical protein
MFSPRQSSFENHRLPLACRNQPASSGTSRFAAPTLIQFVASGNTKVLCSCEQPVEEKPSLWKREEN